MVSFKKLRQMIEVQGSGTITRKEIPVSSFLRLHLSARGTVQIEQADEEKVIIETDENLLDYFEVVNSGRTLYITSEAKLRKPVFSSLKIIVRVRQIDTIYNASQGNVESINPIISTEPITIKIDSHGDTNLQIQAPKIELGMACHGNVTLSGECGEINIKDSAHGNLDCKNLKARHVNLRNMSHGNILLYAEETIAIKHMGHGFVHYYGPGRLKDVKQYGHGEVKHMKD
jgi:hypothetical protein